MISAKRATSVVFEKDRTTREGLVDKLKEQDAKHVLKMLLRVFNHEMPEGWPDHGTSKEN